MSDSNLELAQEHADLMEMALEYQYRPEQDPYSACFEPDDPQQEEDSASAGLDYHRTTTEKGQTEELQRTLKRRLKGQPMSVYGDRVRSKVNECRPGNLCGFQTCGICGIKQRDEMAEELIPVVKAWMSQFGVDHASFVSVDGEVCSVAEVIQTMNRFRRRFENTYLNNLDGTEVRGEFELALTWKDELSVLKPKPIRIRNRQKGKYYNVIYDVMTELGSALVYKRDIHRGRKPKGWFIRDIKGNRINIIQFGKMYSNFNGKGMVSTYLDHGVKLESGPNAESIGENQDKSVVVCITHFLVQRPV
jgi:hypothetical protein